MTELVGKASLQGCASNEDWCGYPHNPEGMQLDHGETKEVRGLILEPSFLLLVSEAYPDKHGEIRDPYSIQCPQGFQHGVLWRVESLRKVRRDMSQPHHQRVCAMCNIRSKSRLPTFVAHVQHQLTEEKSSPIDYSGKRDADYQPCLSNIETLTNYFQHKTCSCNFLSLCTCQSMYAHLWMFL